MHNDAVNKFAAAMMRIRPSRKFFRCDERFVIQLVTLSDHGFSIVLQLRPGNKKAGDP
ncbi:MAG: hypothetical protein AAGF31_08470 [Planctomycetota bacterium]